MTRTKTIIKFYFLFLLSSVLLHSCCSEPTRVTIVGTGELSFIGTDESPSGTGIIEEVGAGPFSIFVNFELEFASQFKPELMSSAYGFSCDEEFQNSLVKSSLSLTTDKDLIHDGEIRKAGSELKDLKGLIILVSSGEVVITFSHETRDVTEFASDTYTFSLSISTDDGLDMVSEGSLSFEN